MSNEEVTEILEQQTYISEEHGVGKFNVVEKEGSVIIIFEDGYAFKSFSLEEGFFEIPSNLRYQLTTISGLPGRDENPPVVKMSLNYSVVVDVFTGEYVDPLNLHKLTDVIVDYDYEDDFYILYRLSCIYNYEPPLNDDDIISIWDNKYLNKSYLVQYNFSVVNEK